MSSSYGQSHNSVVITVFRSGILDLSCFLLMTLSCTSHGDSSSMLPCLLRPVPPVRLLEFLEVFLIFFAELPLKAFLFPLLLITFERLPL